MNAAVAPTKAWPGGHLTSAASRATATPVARAAIAITPGTGAPIRSATPTAPTVAATMAEAAHRPRSAAIASPARAATATIGPAASPIRANVATGGRCEVAVDVPAHATHS